MKLDAEEFKLITEPIREAARLQAEINVLKAAQVFKARYGTDLPLGGEGDRLLESSSLLPPPPPLLPPARAIAPVPVNEVGHSVPLLPGGIDSGPVAGTWSTPTTGYPPVTVQASKLLAQDPQGPYVSYGQQPQPEDDGGGFPWLLSLLAIVIGGAIAVWIKNPALLQGLPFVPNQVGGTGDVELTVPPPPPSTGAVPPDDPMIPLTQETP